MLMKFALVVLFFCAGVVCGQHPSAAEFNLFCRILAEANNMMYGPDYVYDENLDREIIKEMTVLYNATTGDMDDFRKTLWDTKDFFEEHPPPTHSESRKRAHREIGNLIKKGEEKIEENKKIAEKVNEKFNEAKLSVAKGLYGEHVTEVPKDDKNLTEILTNTSSIFGHNTSAKDSCGNGGANEAGKTLINDLFCVCAGEGLEAERPCHPKIWPPKSWKDKGQGSWTLIKFGSVGTPTLVPSFNESFQKIEHVCREEMMANDVNSKDMTALLREYVEMIGMGNKKTKKDKKIFGHSERNKGNKGANQVEECTGTGSNDNFDGPEKHNNNICVDYSHNLKDEKTKTYNITWHEKFKNYTKIMQDAKKIEERILKNRAALLLLKSQAWVAYSREKDDETSNLDDMNEGITWERRAMAEKKTEEREYIDVSQETTEPSQPSQPVQGQGAPGNPPHYILISSTETSQPSPKKTDEGKGGGREEPEVTVISSESTTQEAPSPSQGPSQTQQDPPTQSAKRLREEKKTGE